MVLPGGGRSNRPGSQVRDGLGAHSVVALTASSWRSGQDTCTQGTCLEIQSESEKCLGVFLLVSSGGF